MLIRCRRFASLHPRETRARKNPANGTREHSSDPGPVKAGKTKADRKTGPTGQRGEPFRSVPVPGHSEYLNASSGALPQSLERASGANKPAKG